MADEAQVLDLKAWHGRHVTLGQRFKDVIALRHTISELNKTLKDEKAVLKDIKTHKITKLHKDFIEEDKQAQKFLRDIDTTIMDLMKFFYDFVWTEKVLKNAIREAAKNKDEPFEMSQSQLRKIEQEQKKEMEELETIRLMAMVEEKAVK